MNYVIKAIAITWLAASFLVIQFGIGLVFTIFLISDNLNFLVGMGPLIGITNLICIIMLMVRVVKSNPMGWICGKAKIQREEDSANA